MVTVIMVLNYWEAYRCPQQAELDERRQYQHRTIHEHDETFIEEGQMWYIIDKVWLSSWHQCVSNESQGPTPGPISNHTLLDNEGNALPNLEKGKDYSGVNAATWSFFHRVYGGGPAIPRFPLDIYADLSMLPVHRYSPAQDGFKILAS